MAVTAHSFSPPLCVDLDGTLVLSDMLFESLLKLVRSNPLSLLRLPLWLLRGRSVLKAEVAARATLDPADLPYDHTFVEWLAAERQSGRSLWLCTACNERTAAAVAAHFGLFDGVLASDRETNLAGERKAQRLLDQFGAGGFDYCGNERRDLAVWRHARSAIVVHAQRNLEQEAAKCAPVTHRFPARTDASASRSVLRTLRPHQWAKNILILVPLLAAHRAGELSLLASALRAAVAFCLCASSVYVVNDLLDLAADRVHPLKSRRPFAAGDLPLAAGFVLAPSLLAAAAAIAVLLPRDFQLAFGGYYALTLAYSFVLKGQVLIDAVALAGLYTLRIIAGAAAVNVPLSFWLLLFAVFLFMSLALVKRFAELDTLRRQHRLRAAGRGYHVEDLPLLQSLGTAAGYLSVLVLALYINSPEIEALYHRPRLIWMLCVLMLYWISRVWMTAQRGAMHEDPVVFALKDRVSLLVGLLAVLTVAVAT